MNLWPFGRRKAPTDPRTGAALLLASDAARKTRRNAGELLEAYIGHPWLRRVVNRVSHDVASQPWEAWRATPAARRALRATAGSASARAKTLRTLKQAGNLEPIENHPMLGLIERGCDAFDGVAVRQIATMQVDLAGEGFWLPELNPSGEPVQTWVLPPTWVCETPQAWDASSTFKVRLPQQGVEIEFPQSLIVWLRDFSPVNPYGRGVGFAGALDDEIDADQAAASHIRGFFTNNAIPPAVAFIEGLQAEEIERFEERWRQKTQGLSRFRLPMFLSKKFEIHELGQKFADMELVELRRFFASAVQQVYGVPPEILGAVENSNRATIDAADHIYAKRVLVPRLDRLRAGYQQLANRYGDGVIIDYVSPVEEDREFTLKVMQAAPYAFFDDEWRELAGQEPLPNDEGQVRRGPTKVQPLDAETPEAEPAAPPEADDDETEDEAERSAAPVIAFPVRPEPAVVSSVTGSISPGPLRRMLSPQATRRENQRTRDALRRALRAGSEPERIRAVFRDAIERRARLIAHREATESGPSEARLRADLRAAFAVQERAALEALETSSRTAAAS